MKPRVGIFGLSGCWGEQIVILNCEDELLDLLGAIEVVDFLGGSSENDESGPLDIALVEGSVGQARDEETLRKVRARSKLLIACGSCACFGGVSAADGERPREELAALVYGEGASFFDIRPHRPLSDFVTVDAAIPGCPMEKTEFLQAVANLLNGNPPLPATTPVCHECRMAEQECLLLARGIPCLGSITTSGCGARCPSYGVPCIGCRGPIEEANLESWREVLKAKGWNEAVLKLRARTFAAPVLDRWERKGAA